jgi:hypothetical protein
MNDLAVLAQSLRDLPEAVAQLGAKLVFEEAQSLSHGPFSTQQLRGMYNPRGPYSKADPHPPADPSVINIQSGLFASEWVQTVERKPSRIDVVTYNAAPHARYLEGGTDKMIPRGLPDRLTATVTPKIEAFAQAALPTL